jgi:ATP-dependent RNA helicase RhlE
VPLQSEDYIHRVGRTARAELKGDAFTLVSPQEEGELKSIERAVGKRLPRVTLPDFDYAAKPAGKLEIPIHERMAAHRAQRGDERARQRANEARRAAAGERAPRGPDRGAEGGGGRGTRGPRRGRGGPKRG